jgi:hypothetical protein
MRDTDFAFPARNRWDSGTGSFDLEDSGVTLPRYAAIHLKVPRSGDPEIDAMIRESRRADFAGKALEGKLAGILASSSWDSREIRTGRITKEAFDVADAMLAEWEKNEQK